MFRQKSLVSTLLLAVILSGCQAPKTQPLSSSAFSFDPGKIEIPVSVSMGIGLNATEKCSLVYKEAVKLKGKKIQFTDIEPGKYQYQGSEHLYIDEKTDSKNTVDAFGTENRLDPAYGTGFESSLECASKQGDVKFLDRDDKYRHGAFNEFLISENHLTTLTGVHYFGLHLAQGKFYTSHEDQTSVFTIPSNVADSMLKHLPDLIHIGYAKVSAGKYDVLFVSEKMSNDKVRSRRYSLVHYKKISP